MGDRSASEIPTAPCSPLSYQPTSPTNFQYNKLELSDDLSISDNFFTPPEVEDIIDEEISISLVPPQKSVSCSSSLNNSNAMVLQAPLLQSSTPGNLWDNHILLPFFMNFSYGNERIIRRELDILLNIWSNLQPETGFDYSVETRFQDIFIGSVSKDTISSFQMKDLFLVPFKYLPMTYSVRDSTTSDSYMNSSVNVQKLSGKWDMFISECLINLKRTSRSLGLSEHKHRTSVLNEVRNQWDHFPVTISSCDKLSKNLDEQKIIPK